MHMNTRRWYNENKDKWHIWEQPDQPKSNSKTTNENTRKIKLTQV